MPAIRLDPRAKLVAVCDANAELLEKRKTDWGVDLVTHRSRGDLRAIPTSTR